VHQHQPIKLSKICRIWKAQKNILFYIESVLIV
jgi:hypothetical protein